MLSMRLTCILALAGAFGFSAATVACTQQTAASPNTGDDDDDTEGDDDTAGDDDDDKADGGSSSGSVISSSSSSSSGAPVDAGPPPKSKMTFFITSVPAGTGGNLGGLDGADKKCQELATAVQGGDHTWKAYLGAQNPVTNPKDRIGKGPWQNQKGVVVATDLVSLLDIQKQLSDTVFVDEKGGAIPAEGRYILTGSLADGTPTQNNCQNWTSAAQNANARYGDTTPGSNPNAGANWAFAKAAPGNNNNSNCTTDGMKAVKSQGRIACFATD